MQRLRKVTVDAVTQQANDPNYDDSAREAWVQERLKVTKVTVSETVDQSGFDAWVREAKKRWGGVVSTTLGLDEETDSADAGSVDPSHTS